MTQARDTKGSADPLYQADGWSGLDRDDGSQLPEFETSLPAKFLTIVLGYLAIVLFGIAIAA